MEIKKWLGAIAILSLLSCSQKTFTIEELRGTYHEIKPSGQMNPSCWVQIENDSMLLQGCDLSGNVKAMRLKVILDNKLSYYIPKHGFSATLDISEEKGKIHLHEYFEGNQSIEFQKID